MTATDHAKVLDTLAENLRKINSLRDFVAGVEVGAKIAGEMLTTMESAMNDVGRLLAVALLTATALTSASAATLKRFDDRLVLTGHIEMGDDVVFAAAAADRDVKTAVLGSHGVMSMWRFRLQRPSASGGSPRLSQAAARVPAR